MYKLPKTNPPLVGNKSRLLTYPWCSAITMWESAIHPKSAYCIVYVGWPSGAACSSDPVALVESRMANCFSGASHVRLWDGFKNMVGSMSFPLPSFCVHTVPLLDVQLFAINSLLASLLFRRHYTYVLPST